MNKRDLRFWLAGPQHAADHRAVVFRTIDVDLADSGMSELEIINDLASWLPSVPNGVDHNEESHHPSYQNGDDAYYLANRIYYDEDGEAFIYEEPFGKWVKEVGDAMLSLKLKLVEENSKFLLRNSTEVTGNFDGWRIDDWTVEAKSPPNSTTELVWDVVTWSKKFNSKKVTAIVGAGWPLY
jgi:hypothetical protein